MAKKEIPLWKQFENRVRTETNTFGVTCIQIPTEVRMFRVGPEFRSQRVKSHADFAASIFGLSAFFDAKSTEEDNWNIGRNILRKDTRIDKLHQWEKLLEMHQKGAISGYLVWFIQSQRIVWISVQSVLDAMSVEQKSFRADTPGLISTSDSVNIDLKTFMSKEIEARRHVLRGTA